MKKIVITGGIGSGKSSACRLFAKLGVPIIDADKIARDLVEKSSPAYSAIIQYFGESFCLADGHLNRTKLRETIFADPQKKSWLEAYLHPLIRQSIQNALSKIHNSYVLLDIPLYFEGKKGFGEDRVLLVDVPVALQIERVCERDKISEEAAKAIIAAQASREERLLGADDFLDNTQSLADLEKKIVILHKFYSSLS